MAADEMASQQYQHSKLLSLFLYLRYKNAVPVELRLVRLSELAHRLW